MGMTRRTAQIVGLFVVSGLLVGCDEPPTETAERIRAIKPYYVSEPAGGDVRVYTGTVIAANTSALSFAVSGTVATVDVSRSDRVAKGQVLATLETDSFDLDVEAAQSQLDTSQAEYENIKVDLERQKQLFDKGWVAKAAYDQAVSAYQAADGRLNLARSRLGLAERDLRNTVLTAPFDGVLTGRDVDPFVEVTKGQAIFLLDSEGALEVNLSVPDSIIGRLSVGMPVTIESPSTAGCGCTARITEIGANAGPANAVAVKAAILESPGGLLPGMPVEVGVALADNGGARGFMIPLVAIAPGEEEGRGYVFKYDETSGSVTRSPISGGDTISGNLIGVAEGVSAGDILAAAGVTLLRDGQRVKLLGE